MAFREKGPAGSGFTTRYVHDTIRYPRTTERYISYLKGMLFTFSMITFSVVVVIAL